MTPGQLAARAMMRRERAAAHRHYAARLETRAVYAALPFTRRLLALSLAEVHRCEAAHDEAQAARYDRMARLAHLFGAAEEEDVVQAVDAMLDEREGLS